MDLFKVAKPRRGPVYVDGRRRCNECEMYTIYKEDTALVVIARYATIDECEEGKINIEVL